MEDRIWRSEEVVKPGKCETGGCVKGWCRTRVARIWRVRGEWWGEDIFF